jgi:uncharacterized protein YjiS (DUF1127 family)
MAYSSTYEDAIASASYTAPATPAPGIADHFAAMFHSVAQWRARRNTIAILSDLSDHTLWDIGVHRSAIPMVARSAASGHPKAPSY